MSIKLNRYVNTYGEVDTRMCGKTSYMKEIRNTHRNLTRKIIKHKSYVNVKCCQLDKEKEEEKEKEKTTKNLNYKEILIKIAVKN